MIIWNTTSLILCNIRSVYMRTRYQHYRILHSSLVIMCSIYVVKVNDNGFLQKLTSGSHYLKLAAALHWQSVAGAQLPACTWPPGAVQVSLWGYTGKEIEKKKCSFNHRLCHDVQGLASLCKQLHFGNLPSPMWRKKKQKCSSLMIYLLP